MNTGDGPKYNNGQFPIEGGLEKGSEANVTQDGGNNSMELDYAKLFTELDDHKSFAVERRLVGQFREEDRRELDEGLVFLKKNESFLWELFSNNPAAVAQEGELFQKQGSKAHGGEWSQDPWSQDPFPCSRGDWSQDPWSYDLWGLLMGQSDHQGVDGNNSAMLALSSSVAQPPPSATQTVPPENFVLGSSSVAQPHPSATLTVPSGNFELGSSSAAQPPPSATQTVRPENFKLGSSSAAQPPPSATQTVRLGNFELGSSSVAHAPSSATLTVPSGNFELGSSSAAQPPPSATQTVRPGNFKLGSSSAAQPPPSATQTVRPGNFELGSSSVAHPPSSATQTVCPWNFEMGSSIVAQPPPSSTQTVRPENFELGSSSVARAPPSATQTVRLGNFELGSSSVAQPPPSTTQTVCPVNFELGSSNIAQPPPSTIPIKVLLGGGRAYQQHQYTVHVKPDEEVVVLRKLLKERKVAYLPQHYLFAFKREVMNEDRSFREHGIVSVQDTKIEVMDFTVHFPPHHRLREAGIASNRQLAIRR